ncbi:MAG TPA: IF-2 protein, partial [Myxococcales bacterium]|nr:IF-2 protein [Myxococcales bacterium]
TEEQRASLKGMMSELSYYLARTRLDDARKQLAEAMSQLQIAADSNDRHARSAHQMLLEIREPAKALEESLRKAVHSLSSPAEAPAPAKPPAPAAPAPTPGPTPSAPAPGPAPAPGSR